MNKKDLSTFKKVMKLESPFFTIERLWSFYIQKDIEDISMQRSCSFLQLDETEQDMLMKNFKKILTGTLDVKIFELKPNMDNGNTTVEALSQVLDSSHTDANTHLESVMNKFLSVDMYETDVVVHIAKVIYDTSELTRKFILCTVNKVERGKKQLIADFNSGNFDMHSDNERIVNLKSPLDGFMYPVYEDGSANTQKILYYSGKANKTNFSFVNDIIDCNITLTAKQEKECFNSLLARVAAGKVSPTDLYKFYTSLKDRYENEEDTEYRTFGLNEIADILNSLEDFTMREDLNTVYREVFSSEEYQIKVDNIIPDFSKKSINLDNDDLLVTMTPKNLENVIQARDENNQLYLLMKINGSLVNDGLPVKTELVERICFE